MASRGINRSTRLQQRLTALLLLAFFGAFGYLYLLSRSMRSEEAKAEHLDTPAMKSQEMVAYREKANRERALIQAVREDNAAQVEAFLQQGMTGSTQIAGRPLAMYAIVMRAEKTLALLMARGMDINVRGDQDSTLLMKAMQTGKPAFVEMLLKQGADVNAVDNQGRTALMYAANAWKDSLSTENRPPQVWGKDTTRRMLLPLLERHARIDSVDKDGMTALNYAAGQPDMANMLLDRGADPNDALLRVIGDGDKELLQRLLDAGVKLNQKDRHTGQTALAYARKMAKNDPREIRKVIVQMLLKAGAKD